MPSGKQILQSVLAELSQSEQTEDSLDFISDRVRAALLINCSTASETWFTVEKMGWISEYEDDELIKQGLGIKSKRIFLSDLFEYLVEDGIIPESVKRRFPDLSQEEFNDATFIIWHILSSLQYWKELSVVENGGVLALKDREKMIESYLRELSLFKENSYEYLGLENPNSNG
ncbi:MAG: hypothetical protein F6K10_32895 [Moorea sp. SIO2B7]|nr:hypothetical protein [Moorena sp. SIO2B7]